MFRDLVIYDWHERLGPASLIRGQSLVRQLTIKSAINHTPILGALHPWPKFIRQLPQLTALTYTCALMLVDEFDSLVEGCSALQRLSITISQENQGILDGFCRIPSLLHLQLMFEGYRMFEPNNVTPLSLPSVKYFAWTMLEPHENPRVIELVRYIGACRFNPEHCDFTANAIWCKEPASLLLNPFFDNHTSFRVQLQLPNLSPRSQVFRTSDEVVFELIPFATVFDGVASLPRLLTFPEWIGKQISMSAIFNTIADVRRKALNGHDSLSPVFIRFRIGCGQWKAAIQPDADIPGGNYMYKLWAFANSLRSVGVTILDSDGALPPHSLKPCIVT
jgi:hypothetical protein